MRVLRLRAGGCVSADAEVLPQGVIALFMLKERSR
jgi:hypothetical protein